MTDGRHVHLTLLGEVWLVGMLPAAVLIAAEFEWERRRSLHEDERRHTLLPGVGGVGGALVWPLVAVVVLAIGTVWVIARSGRTVLDLLGVGDGGGPAA